MTAKVVYYDSLITLLIRRCIFSILIANYFSVCIQNKALESIFIIDCKDSLV